VKWTGKRKMRVGNLDEPAGDVDRATDDLGAVRHRDAPVHARAVPSVSTSGEGVDHGREARAQRGRRVVRKPHARVIDDRHRTDLEGHASSPCSRGGRVTPVSPSRVDRRVRAQELTVERRNRIRSEERADMAAHLHDSVLQTLALVAPRR